MSPAWAPAPDHLSMQPSTLFIVPILLAAAMHRRLRGGAGQHPGAQLARRPAPIATAPTASAPATCRRSPDKPKDGARAQDAGLQVRAAQAGTVMPQLAKGYTDEQIDLVAGVVRGAKTAVSESRHDPAIAGRRDLLECCAARRGRGGVPAARRSVGGTAESRSGRRRLRRRDRRKVPPHVEQRHGST